MPYIGRAPTASITKLEDADQDTKIQVEESSDEDIIRFDIAGAEDFTMTANTLNVLSGSTLNIAGGATISNSGTATGLADDMEAAYAGVLEANATFVDQAIFGPSVDGKSWNGKWSVASLYSSLMLVTIEDAGADTQVNIWDLTEVSSSAPSTTPLGTVTLSGDATPTSVAACMGYIIVGSEDGISIIDPHSGSWAERTVGWPRTLSTSTSPALTDNDVSGVSANVWDSWPLDPRTGGTMPCFGIEYGAGADANSIIKYDGTVYDRSGTPSATTSVGIAGGRILKQKSGVIQASPLIDTIVADDWNNIDIQNTGSLPYGLTADTAMDATNNFLAAADATGATFTYPVYTVAGFSNNAIITRAYNTGYMLGDIRGAWLANSATADRSYKANTLTENGTVTEAAVESGAELMGYSGFSDTTNWFSRAYDADLDFGAGDYSFAYWFKRNGSTGTNFVMRRTQSPAGGAGLIHAINPGGTINAQVTDSSNEVNLSTTEAFADNAWHMTVTTWNGTTKTLDIYVDGVLSKTGTNGSVETLSNGTAILTIGGGVGGAEAADETTLSLVRISATNPSATQIRQMYDAEKPMFVANAECLLQSGSTDAVLDVDVDPLTGKVLVTQTDAITIFDGLAVDSKPTVNSGSSEKGKLWGALRAEQNSANAYVTAPAVDQRQVNEMVRGLASDLPKGVDLSKAKAWGTIASGAGSISESYNVKSVTLNATGQVKIEVAIPFKTTTYAILANANSRVAVPITGGNQFKNTFLVYIYDIGETSQSNSGVTFACFGELENE